ncbi:hypothetical protein [Limosilactobacillus mucosae]|uniref:Uncharacterized protein n=1 Tax=Limosilactobacillus mucosae TaxID=97478 RepID=A0AAJ1M7X7_LIMMU|nr:hypothetical protein [Limosilactobacillus mucosae]MDC2828507.1 hypothetical protein [Limosilactobacillus mucosae]MDC2834519.1 hypothetical protein [Limosilactobacillus mucosae]
MTNEIFAVTDSACSIERSQMQIAKYLTSMKEESFCLAKYRANRGLAEFDSETFDKMWRDFQAKFAKELEKCVTETSGLGIQSCTKCGAWFVDDSQAPKYVLDGGETLLCQDCFDKAFPTSRSWDEYIVRSEIESSRANRLGALTGIITVSEAIEMIDNNFKNLTDDQLSSLASKVCDNPEARCYYTEA